MALITRISRLFKADFHAVLDQVEEPEMLLRQAIREMEDDLSEAELRQHYRRDEVDELQLRRDELEQALGEIDEELDVCFDSGEDDLARDLIRRKLQTQRLLKQVSARFVATGKDLQRQQKALEENRAALESMRQKAELYVERAAKPGRDTTSKDALAWSARELSVSDNDVEVALLREKKRRVES